MGTPPVPMKCCKCFKNISDEEINKELKNFELYEKIMMAYTCNECKEKEENKKSAMLGATQ